MTSARRFRAVKHLLALAVATGMTAAPAAAQLNQPLHRDGWILAAAHAPGLQGSIWRTDLWIYVSAPSTTPVRLRFCESGKDNTTALLHSVDISGPNRVHYFEDAVEHFLQLGGGAWLGAIQYSGPRDMQIWARVYSISADGSTSYGQLIEGVPSSDMSPDSDPWMSREHQWIYATKHTADGRYRVNLGIVNPTAEDSTYSVTMYDDHGENVFGETVPVPPYSMVQLSDPFAAVNGGDWNNYYIRVACNTEGGGSFAYASVVDNATNDAYFVRGVKQYGPAERLGMNCTEHLDGWVLAAARTPGLQGSIWRTDLWIRASYPFGTTTITLRFCRSGEDGTAAPPHTITLAGDDSDIVYLEDVVGHFLGSEADPWVGSIHYSAAPAVQVWARVYSISPDGTRSYGQLVEGIPTADMSPDNDPFDANQQQYIVAAKHTADGRFRVNIGLVNPTGIATTNAVNVLDAALQTVTTIAVPLKPYSMVQLSDPLASVNGGEWNDLLVRVQCSKEGGGVFAYASVVDNATNDAHFVRGIKLLTPGGA